MSTTARRELFAGWIDDAAVFPPGNAPLPEAWRAHRALRAGPYADLLGPLLIATSAAQALVDLVEDEKSGRQFGDSRPVDVSVVARPGIPAEDLLAAVATLRQRVGLQVVGVETAHDPADPESLQRVLGLGLSTAVEVSRDVSPALLLELAERAHRDGAGQIIAKLRTQATPQAPPPSATQVATFLINAHRVGMPVKLTGGLHQALRHGIGARAEHGCLNVLVAAASVAQGCDGADRDFVVDILEQRDAAPLIDAANSWTAAQISKVRAAFPSFGCCGVLDPIGELTALGLITPTQGDGADGHPDADRRGSGLSHADRTCHVGT